MKLKLRKHSFFIAAFMIMIAGFTTYKLADASTKFVEQSVLTVETKNGPVVFHIEIAQTAREHAKGLMNRSSLAKDAGMLFVFGTEEQQEFWMKDTLIPLDILFLARDGKIHHIHRMAKPLDKDSLITSERPVKAVLEINGGLSDMLGISEGDKVIHPAFRNQLPEPGEEEKKRRAARKRSNYN